MTERTLKNVEILEKKSLYKKFFEVDEYLMRYPQYNGKMSNPVRREVMDRGHAVGILLFDPDRDNCLLYTSPSPRDRQKSRMPSSA